MPKKTALALTLCMPGVPGCGAARIKTCTRISRFIAASSDLNPQPHRLPAYAEPVANQSHQANGRRLCGRRPSSPLLRLRTDRSQRPATYPGRYRCARAGCRRPLRNQRVVAVERMFIGGVVPILQPRQQSVDQRHLVIERLRDLEQGLAQSASDPLAVAEPFEAGRELDVFVQVVNRVAGKPLPIRRLEQLADAGELVAIGLGNALTAIGALSDAYRYSPISCKPLSGVFQVTIGSIAPSLELP